MTQAEKLKQVRQLLQQVINNPPTMNWGSGEQWYSCGRYTTDMGNTRDHTQQAHATNCLTTEITRCLLED